MKAKIKTLFIIGNGFDNFHQLDTDYYHFAKYFSENFPTDFNTAFKYYPSLLNDFSSEYWKYFENELSQVDYDQIKEDNYAYLSSPSADDFRDSYWHDFSYEISNLVNEIKTCISDAFESWVKTIEINISSKKEFQYNINQFFITFNYTKTLEILYDIPTDKIFHIHGTTDGYTKPIFGHNQEYKYDYDENSDMAYIWGEQEIEKYFNETRKNTEKIIRENVNLFKRLDNVETIFVLGHSMNEIDLPYFTEIKKNTPQNTLWKVSALDCEKERLRSVLENLNVQFDFIQIKEVFK